jgi:hypothetical protein
MLSLNQHIEGNVYPNETLEIAQAMKVATTPAGQVEDIYRTIKRRANLLDPSAEI